MNEMGPADLSLRQSRRSSSARVVGLCAPCAVLVVCVSECIQFLFRRMRPRPSLFVAVAAAALGQRSSATRTGGGLEHLLVQHGSGACARRARTRCALTSWCSGRRWPRLSVDCCVLLLTMSEEETRASARGAFCSLAVYGTLSRPASRNADVAAFGSRCTPRAGASIFISAVLVLLLRRGPQTGTYPGRVAGASGGLGGCRQKDKTA